MNTQIDGVYLLAAILLVSAIGMTCIIIDMIYNKEEKRATVRKHVTKPKEEDEPIEYDIEFDESLLD